MTFAAISFGVTHYFTQTYMDILLFQFNKQTRSTARLMASYFYLVNL